MEMKHKSLNNALLVLTALIWGSAFVAQSVGMDYIGPFTFNAVRNILGGFALLPVIYVMKRKRKKAEGVSADYSAIPNADGHLSGYSSNFGEERKQLLLGGICCGICLMAGSSLQQIGLQYTSPGKGGFITALYMLIVPILGLVIGKRAGIKTWIGVVLAVIGMYFLCITDGFSIAKGDFIILLASVAFAFHILVIDYFSERADGVSMSCIQFFVCGVLSIFPMFLVEHPTVTGILLTWKPIAYTGILSSGVGYTLQIVAQKNTDPTVASLLLSLESVFSVLAGWLILGDLLSGRELFGCLLVFIAVILAQLPEKQYYKQ